MRFLLLIIAIAYAWPIAATAGNLVNQGNSNTPSTVIGRGFLPSAPNKNLGNTYAVASSVTVGDIIVQKPVLRTGSELNYAFDVRSNQSFDGGHVTVVISNSNSSVVYVTNLNLKTTANQTNHITQKILIDAKFKPDTYSIKINGTIGHLNFWQAHSNAFSVVNFIDGVCGSAVNSKLNTVPAAASLCSTGIASPVTLEGTSFKWNCLSTNGGNNAECRSAYVAPVNGACGLAFGISSFGPPIAQLCASGEHSPIGIVSNSFVWVCYGSAGGSNISCAANKLAAINGACGASNGTSSVNPPTSSLCATGTSSNVSSGTNNFTWSCTGINGGSNIGCAANRLAAINGVCGASNGTSSVNSPTSSLCTIGTSSAVSSGTNNFTWSCAGINGGSNISCATNRIFPSAGICGTANGKSSAATPTIALCAAGESSIVTTGANGFTWTCTGSNGGAQAACAAPLTQTLNADIPADVAAYSAKFAEWSALASAETSSPIALQPGDLQKQWTGPDGRTVSLIVQVPHPLDAAPTVTMETVPAGADARPYFEAAVQKVKTLKAGKLVIPSGDYDFKTVGTTGYHWEIASLKDVIIDGQGSVLRFYNNSIGIHVYQSQRLMLKNFKLEYKLTMSSIGRVVQLSSGQYGLSIDQAYPVTTDDKVSVIVEYDPATSEYVIGGKRVIFGPASSSPTFAGNQIYTSSQITSALAGKTFLVRHHYYGGTAIYVGDFKAKPTPTEDVVLDTITVRSSPGIGFGIGGVKRGIAVVNSAIEKSSGQLLSTEYDGIHILQAAGDILVANNTISDQSDDGVNIHAPVTPVISHGTNKEIVLGKYSSFYKTGDRVAFFDANNKYLGSSVLATATYNDATTQLTATITDSLDLQIAVFARDVNLASNRTAIVDNTIKNCYCHGILSQEPNTLVSGNNIQNTSANAIRALANSGTFLEGTGAIDTVIENNTLQRIGWESPVSTLPMSGISVYAPNSTNSVDYPYPTNTNVIVRNNTISDTQQGCVTIANTLTANVTGNTCSNNNLSGTPSQKMNLLKAYNITLQQQ